MKQLPDIAISTLIFFATLFIAVFLVWYSGQDKGVDDWMRNPVYIVRQHKSGKGLYAEGLEKDIYLHDFRFKFCEVV